MNAVLKSWGSKFVVVSHVQQLWKRPLFSCHYNRDQVLSPVLWANRGHLPVKISDCHLQIFRRQLSISKNRCWKCNAVVTERDLVCMSCASVQEPKQGLNFYELFKETPHFDMDIRNLTVKFRRLQTLLHPDKIATRPEKEKEYSAEQSALVNKAYQTLLRPIDRGLYLLELYSKPLREDEIQLPSDFLMNIMEVNETLEECRSPEVLESIRHVNNAKVQMLYADVSLAFKEKNIEKARVSLCKLKYFLNLDEKIKRLEDDLGVSRDD